MSIKSRAENRNVVENLLTPVQLNKWGHGVLYWTGGRTGGQG